MGAMGGNTRTEVAQVQENRSQKSTSMEIGAVNLDERFSRLAVDDPSKDGRSLFQVMKAVEAAENIIKQQYEENNLLKMELESKMRELQKYKTDASMTVKPTADVLKDVLIPEPSRLHQSVPLGSMEDKARWTDRSSSVDHQSVLVPHRNAMPSENPTLQTSLESQYYSEENKASGIMRSQGSLDNVSFSQFSPSSRSLSPSRYQIGGDFDPTFGSTGRGVIPVPEANNRSSLLKQDLIHKVREHEEEIVQLRKHLADCSLKEVQIRNEKFVLQKRIAYMRRAFDQQQQDLVDAASKALSYRQDVIEENIRLSYALQVAEQERTTFVSSLLPLLADYNLQPAVSDAQSIVNNLKVLFKHLQEKLIIIEDKLKDSQYQLAPWRSDLLMNPNFPPQSHYSSFGAVLNTSNKNGLEIVPQPAYTQPQTTSSPPADVQTTRTDWESVGHHIQHPGFGVVASKNLDHDNLGGSSPSASRKPMGQDIPTLGSQNESHVTFGEEKNNIPLSVNDGTSGSEVDKSDLVGIQNTREQPAHWGSRGSTFSTNDDPNSSFSPYLPPVLEEPSSSFSEAAEDDPLPAIEGLQITGEAYPGRELQASGYSINGTTSCNFEWVRYLDNGSVNYINGAKQPNYLVTADDVDFRLAIEVQPLDDRKRKGELVKVFANDQRKINCDPEMQDHIEKTLALGHTSYEVSLSAGIMDIWEPAVLAIKREGYSIKCNGPRGVVVAEKFSQNMTVAIPYGSPTEFLICGSSGAGYLLRTLDSSSLRDTIVLTLRLFIMRAVERRKGKRKGLFFNK